MTNKDFVKAEREYMIKFLQKLTPRQWEASTLCEGWTVEDLAAHIVVREGVIGPIGIVVPQLHTLHDNRVKKLEAKGRTEIIRKLQRYPWWMPAVANTGEFYVHNEDFLRGELHMSRPAPSAEAQAILWSSLSGLVKINKRMVSDLGNLTLENIQTSEVIIIINKHSSREATIKGLASELLLFCYGRRDAAKVTIKKVTL